jgi:signal transduction histidine kinase
LFDDAFWKMRFARVDWTALTTALALLVLYTGLRWLGIVPRPYSDYRALVLLSYVPAFLIAAAVVIIVNGKGREGRAVRHALVQANLYTAASFTLALMAESIIAHDYWVIPSLTAGIWLVLHLSIRFGSVAVTLAIIGVQAVIGVASAPLLSRMQASNYAVEFGTVALVIPICILLYLWRVDQRRESLETTSIRQARFIAHVGHDLGQPLNATRLLVGALNETPLSADQRAILQRIGQSVDDTDSLFRSMLDVSMLDVSMLDSDSISVSDDRIELGALLGGLANENAAAAKHAGVTLRVVQSRHIIRSDRVLFGTMIQNLISNAMQHAPGSRVLLGVRMRSGQLSIEVHDTGPGIPSDDLPNVFDEFYQGSPDRAGAGLGLSIVQRLAGILGAEVNLASRLGKGTSASITGLKLEPH